MLIVRLCPSSVGISHRLSGSFPRSKRTGSTKTGEEEAEQDAPRGREPFLHACPFAEDPRGWRASRGRLTPKSAPEGIPRTEWAVEAHPFARLFACALHHPGSAQGPGDVLGKG